MNRNGLSIDDVMNLEEEDLNMLLENIQPKIEENRIALELFLEKRNKEWRLKPWD